MSVKKILIAYPTGESSNDFANLSYRYVDVIDNVRETWEGEAAGNDVAGGFVRIDDYLELEKTLEKSWFHARQKLDRIKQPTE